MIVSKKSTINVDNEFVPLYRNLWRFIGNKSSLAPGNTTIVPSPPCTKSLL